MAHQTPDTKPAGFIAVFGADKPVDIKFEVERVQNMRIRKNNTSMEISADISIEFWINNETSNQALGLSIKNSKFFYQVLRSKDNKTLINQIDSFELGEITIDNSALANNSDLTAGNSSNTDHQLNLTKIESYLNSIKAPLINSINNYLAKQ